MRIKRLEVHRRSDGAIIAHIEGIREARYWELRKGTASENLYDVHEKDLVKATAKTLGIDMRDIYLT